jgi:hypothetical protein
MPTRRASSLNRLPFDSYEKPIAAEGNDKNALGALRRRTLSETPVLVV